MFWINAISTDGSLSERFFVFESFTIAQIIADKLEREGFVTQILDQEYQAVAVFPEDPHRRLMGAIVGEEVDLNGGRTKLSLSSQYPSSKATPDHSDAL